MTEQVSLIQVSSPGVSLRGGELWHFEHPLLSLRRSCFASLLLGCIPSSQLVKQFAWQWTLSLSHTSAPMNLIKEAAVSGSWCSHKFLSLHNLWSTTPPAAPHPWAAAHSPRGFIDLLVQLPAWVCQSLVVVKPLEPQQTGMPNHNLYRLPGSPIFSSCAAMLAWAVLHSGGGFGLPEVFAR